MFRPADPTRRLPVYLQAYTKENAIWQFKLIAAYFLAYTVYEYMNEKRTMAQYRRDHPTDD